MQFVGLPTGQGGFDTLSVSQSGPALPRRLRMLPRILTTACRWLQDWSQALMREALMRDRVPAPELFAPPSPRTYHRLERVVLADAVADTLLSDFAAHRAGPRGEEEVGWVLLGLRE